MKQLFDKTDPMNMFRSAPKGRGKIVSDIPKQNEQSVHAQVCKYLKAQYPHIMFISDFAAGMKMSIGMATRQRMLKSNHSYPDLMIFEPRGLFCGLFIELKRDRDALYKKSGDLLSSLHLSEQGECIKLLNDRGYRATFACGFEEAVKVINDYLK